MTGLLLLALADVAVWLVVWRMQRPLVDTGPSADLTLERLDRAVRIVIANVAVIAFNVSLLIGVRLLTRM